jgi:hypothetical protein
MPNRWTSHNPSCVSINARCSCSATCVTHYQLNRGRCDAGTTNTSAKLYILFQPLAGWRTVKATAQRKKSDFAQVLKELVDVHFPDAEQMRVGLDNLTLHRVGVLDAPFPPEEARRLARQVEFDYTPKPGSWLKLAEIEFSILARPGLGQRLADPQQLQSAVTAWADARNAPRATVHWPFSVSDARQKRHWLYGAE